MPDFTSSQYTANLTSKAIQNEKCCPVQTPNCYNNCEGLFKGLPTITKDLGYLTAHEQMEKRKALRVNSGKYESNIVGNTKCSGT